MSGPASGPTSGPASGRRLVVAALITDDLRWPGVVLAARRTGPPALAGQWEFPGGKVEPGEDPMAALHREIAEELGVVLELGEELVADGGGAWPLTESLEMRTWWAVLASGEIASSTDHDQLRWVTAADLSALEWLPGDRAIVDQLRTRWAAR